MKCELHEDVDEAGKDGAIYITLYPETPEEITTLARLPVVMRKKVPQVETTCWAQPSNHNSVIDTMLVFETKPVVVPGTSTKAVNYIELNNS